MPATHRIVGLRIAKTTGDEYVLDVATDNSSLQDREHLGKDRLR